MLSIVNYSGKTIIRKKNPNNIFTYVFDVYVFVYMCMYTHV